MLVSRRKNICFLITLLTQYVQSYTQLIILIDLSKMYLIEKYFIDSLVTNEVGDILSVKVSRESSFMQPYRDSFVFLNMDLNEIVIQYMKSSMRDLIFFLASIIPEYRREFQSFWKIAASDNEFWDTILTQNLIQDLRTRTNGLFLFSQNLRYDLNLRKGFARILVNQFILYAKAPGRIDIERMYLKYILLKKFPEIFNCMDTFKYQIMSHREDVPSESIITNLVDSAIELVGSSITPPQKFIIFDLTPESCVIIHDTLTNSGIETGSKKKHVRIFSPIVQKFKCMRQLVLRRTSIPYDKTYELLNYYRRNGIALYYERLMPKKWV